MLHVRIRRHLIANKLLVHMHIKLLLCIFITYDIVNFIILVTFLMMQHVQEGMTLKTWKKRWFVLADFCLFHYKGLACDCYSDYFNMHVKKLQFMLCTNFLLAFVKLQFKLVNLLMIIHYNLSEVLIKGVHFCSQ